MNDLPDPDQVGDSLGRKTNWLWIVIGVLFVVIAIGPLTVMLADRNNGGTFSRIDSNPGQPRGSSGK